MEIEKGRGSKPWAVQCLCVSWEDEKKSGKWSGKESITLYPIYPTVRENESVLSFPRATLSTVGKRLLKWLMPPHYLTFRQVPPVTRHRLTFSRTHTPPHIQVAPPRTSPLHGQSANLEYIWDDTGQGSMEQRATSPEIAGRVGEGDGNSLSIPRS